MTVAPAGLEDDELLRMPARRQAELVANRQVSPVELVRSALRRIELLDDSIGAFITVAADQALEAAQRAEQAVMSGDSIGPLHGVPISIKDIEATSGIRTTLGSRVHEDTVPDFDSVVVERVRNSGAVIIGKTNTPEIAIHMDTVTDNEVRGPCRNPWDLSRTTGGSSGGAAAALATDMCQLAVGSDGGGSIRIPASFCGVFGLKPSSGRVPRARGLGQPDPNQFAQSGPMTNDVRDAALLLQTIAGPHPADPQQFNRSDPPQFAAEIEQGVRGMRIGWSPDLGYGAVDQSVLEQVRSGAQLMEDLGAQVFDLDIDLSPNLADHFWNVFGANAFVQFGHMLDDPRLGDGARKVLEKGRSIAGHQYAASLRAVNELRLQMSTVMSMFNLVVTPTTSITAFRPGQRPQAVDGKKVDSAYGVFPFTYIFNMTGQPAATVPCGFAGGLPVGMQIAGRLGDEASVLRAAAAFEEARPWRGVRPTAVT